jgi:hypothetical protein
MSTQANIVAFDGAATPVTHTLVPVSNKVVKESAIAEWGERLSTLPLIAQVSARMVQNKLKDGRWLVSFSSMIPVMEAVNGANSSGYTAAPKVAYSVPITTTAYFPERATPAERKLVRQLHLNIMGGITTSVTPVTTGPCAEAFDNNIFPS